VGTVKAVFIDRDGTINVEREFVHRIEDWEFIPGAVEALRYLTDHGVSIYIITNQSGIARGYYDEAQFHTLMDHVTKDLREQGVRIEKVLYCPHLPNGSVARYAIDCNCRKPKTGLIDGIMVEQGLDVRDVALIGDKESDIEAGRRLGMVTYLVMTGYGREYVSGTSAVHVKDDILDAVKHLLGID
jgi:D-glycero-D-manno-heptose 1,7-bisphosphate phosphatase